MNLCKGPGLGRRLLHCACLVVLIEQLLGLGQVGWRGWWSKRVGRELPAHVELMVPGSVGQMN